VRHTYSHRGKFTVKLTITDTSGVVHLLGMVPATIVR
jgi:hypothetical protein